MKPPVVVVQIVIAQHVAFSNRFPVEKVIFINHIIGDRFKTKSINLSSASFIIKSFPVTAV